MHGCSFQTSLSPLFDSLRRRPTNWQSLARDPAIAHGDVLDTFRTQGVTQAIASAWLGPAGPMITNDEVAATLRMALTAELSAYPHR